MKAAIYVRVSSKEQDADSQLKECIDLAMREGWDYDIIKEKISAFKNPERERLHRLMSYDHVIVWAYDRLQRNRKAFIELVRAFQARGAKVHSIKDAWLEELWKIPSPWNEIVGDFMLQIVGWMAESESRLRSERVKAAYANRKNEWGRLRKPVNLVRLESCMVEGSLRKITRRYNEGLPKKEMLSYGTVKKIIDSFREGKLMINVCEKTEPLINGAVNGG